MPNIIIARPWGYYSVPNVYSQLPEIPDLVEDKDKSTGNYNILQGLCDGRQTPIWACFLLSDPSPNKNQQIPGECKII